MTVRVENAIVRVQAGLGIGRVYGACARCGVMDEMTEARAMLWDLGSMCETCEEEHAAEAAPRPYDWRQPWL